MTIHVAGYEVGREELREKLSARVERDAATGCLMWIGSVGSHGYGQLYIEGKRYLAHRVAFFLEHGRWPEPQAMHTCDALRLPGDVSYRRCVEPSHLTEGTNHDNIVDMHAKGRSWQCSRTHCPQGHEYAEHGYVYRGKRYCRICVKASKHAARDRRRREAREARSREAVRCR